MNILRLAASWRADALIIYHQEMWRRCMCHHVSLACGIDNVVEKLLRRMEILDQSAPRNLHP